MNSVTPAVSENVEWLGDLESSAKRRGVKLLYVTDITKENLSACKELLNWGTELRHIHGLAGNFGVSHSEYLCVPTVSEDMKPEQIRFVHRDAENVVKQQQLVFDTLWSHAAPGHARIGVGK